MLRKLVEYDKLLLLLLRNSNLTDAQLDVLMSYFEARRSNGSLGQMIDMKDGKRVTKGSFLRTLNQVRGNIKSSVYSISLLSYLGVVGPDFLDGFVKILRLLEELRAVGQVGNPDGVVALIDSLCDRLYVL